MDQSEKAKQFQALHIPGNPIILFNIWDAGSAKAVASAGAQALATGSWSVAAAHGFADGEQLPLDFALANLSRIVEASDLPISIDIEGGYGETPAEVGRTITATIAAGAIGCNIEDSDPRSGAIRAVGDQVQRIAEARRAADAANVPYFINARLDSFLQAAPADHDRSRLDEAIARARAFIEAGADGIFLPGLIDLDLASRAASAIPAPVNLMVVDHSPNMAELRQARIARLSYGPGPFAQAMDFVRDSARQVMANQVKELEENIV